MITHRQTFYISGFDPRGGRHYYGLYRQQMPIQAALKNLNLDISSRHRDKNGDDQWTVRLSDGTHETTTTMTMLGWDDIIRQNWGKNWCRILSLFFRVLMDYILNGLLIRIVRASPKQIAGLYPVLFVCLFLSLQLLTVGGGLTLLFDWYHSSGHPAVWFLAILIPLVLWGLSHLAMRLGKALGVFWLLEIYVFCLRWAHGEIHALDSRLEHFAAQIANAVDNPHNDEVVIVGHSVGAMWAIAAVARVLSLLSAQGRTLPPQRLKLVTLGQCVPLISFHASAHSFRQDLLETAQCSQLLWLDYTAPTDGACFPLLDFITHSGLSVETGKGPKLLSPRFFRLFFPQRYRTLRRDWYAMHFLYLMATDRADGYNYLDITAGMIPVTAVTQ